MNRQTALYKLLLEIFTPQQFVAFVRMSLGEASLAHNLPGTSIAPATFFFEAGEALRRHGLINKLFFEELIKERFAYVTRICEVAAAYGVVAEPRCGVASSEPEPGPRRTEPALVLVLAANPDLSRPLAVGKEFRRVQTVLERGKERNSYRVDQCPDLHLHEVTRHLRLHEPTVVHFSGHGNPDGSLLMLDHNEREISVASQSMVPILGRYREQLALVVLNACYSRTLADALIETGIRCTIGMTQAVDDECAILFSQVFYQALFDGAVVDEAFDEARLIVGGRFPDHTNLMAIRFAPGVDKRTFKVC